MQKTSQQGIDLIKQFEGFSAEPYFCPAGRLTIGYGHVIRDNEQFISNLTPQGAEKILLEDIEHYETAIRRLVNVNLSQGQFDALVSFIYNVGEKAFENSTLLRFLNAGEPEKAARQFARWVYAGGRRFTGLEARRAAEIELFQS